MLKLATIDAGAGSYPIEATESYLMASVSHDREHLEWQIQVAAQGQRLIPGESEPFDEPLRASLFFVAGKARTWKDLVGKHIRYKDLPQEMLPSDPAGFYCGWHLSTAEHDLQFNQIKKGAIDVDWRFVAFDGKRSRRGDREVRLSGFVPLKGVVVHHDSSFHELMRGAKSDKQFDQAFQQWTPNWKLAKSHLRRFFDPEDFGRPVKWRGPVFYPLKGRKQNT
jgi:hypothetical protein